MGDPPSAVGGVKASVIESHDPFGPEKPLPDGLDVGQFDLHPASFYQSNKNSPQSTQRPQRRKNRVREIGTMSHVSESCILSFFLCVLRALCGSSLFSF
jgi:hypothetical protein